MASAVVAVAFGGWRGGVCHRRRAAGQDRWRAGLASYHVGRTRPGALLASIRQGLEVGARRLRAGRVGPHTTRKTQTRKTQTNRDFLRLGIPADAAEAAASMASHEALPGNEPALAKCFFE